MIIPKSPIEQPIRQLTVLKEALLQFILFFQKLVFEEEVTSA